MYITPTHELFKRPDGSWTVGVTDRDTRTIYIADNLRGDFLWKVQCHEICHASMFSHNVYLTIEQEELVADLIATYGREIIEIADQIFYGLAKVG